MLARIAIILLLTTGLQACDNKYDNQTMSLLQPCISSGYPVQQCYAAYNQAGRPTDPNNNAWLGTVAAFTTGVIAHHWWNTFYTPRPVYIYQPSYQTLDIPINTNAPQINSKPWASINQSLLTENKIEKSVEKTMSSSITDKPQPLFTPNKIVENRTSSIQQSITKSSPSVAKPNFRPIQVMPSKRK